MGSCPDTPSGECGSRPPGFGWALVALAENVSLEGNVPGGLKIDRNEMNITNMLYTEYTILIYKHNIRLPCSSYNYST